MVGAILTQNTAWLNVEKAIRNLKKARALSPRALKKTTSSRLAALIKPAGYYNVKAKRLKNFVGFLSSECGLNLKKLSRMPAVDLRKKLMAVNGVGPETCDSILLYAFNRPVFVVDAYTRRVFSRLLNLHGKFSAYPCRLRVGHGLIGRNADYVKIQNFFMNNLQHDAHIFNEYHALIVRLAKEYCRTKPKCGNCPLSGRKGTEMPCK